MDYRLLHAKTVAELRAMAREEKIKIPTGASKAKIVELLLEVENQRAAEMALRQAEAQRSAEQKLAEKQGEKGIEEAPKKRRGRPPKAEKTEEQDIKENAQPKRRTRTAPKAEPVEPEKAAEAAKTELPARENAATEAVHAGKTAVKEPRIEREPEAVHGGKTVVEETRTERAAAAVHGGKTVVEETRTERAAAAVHGGKTAVKETRTEREAEPVRVEKASDVAVAKSEQIASPMHNGRSPARGFVRRDPEQRPVNARRYAESRPEQSGKFQPTAQVDRAPVRQTEQTERYQQRTDFYRRPYEQGERPVQRQDVPARNFEQNERYIRRPEQEQRPYFQPERPVQRQDAAQYERSNQRFEQTDRFAQRSDQDRAPSRPEYRVDQQPLRQEQPRFVRRDYVPQDPNDVTRAVSDLLAAGDCAEGRGVLEPMPDGYGFLRAENYQQGPKDVYVSAAQIRRFNLRTGDLVVGRTRPQREGDRYTALLFIDSVNGESPEKAMRRPRFEDLTPIYPQQRIRLESAEGKNDMALRVIDMLAPIGRGQRAMIVSQPKAGKTVLLKKIANSITQNNPDIELIVLLIDERPEEVTDMQRSIKGDVVYSTFDEVPENHTRVAEMVLERAQRLVEQGKDVVILLDSITRLARAYNLVIPPTGRTLSGGLDPGALHKPKRFFGAARNIENGGSLTIIATALVETGSRMDDIIFEEFKGTGNSEIHLDRKLSEKRIFPAVDMNKSGTRREDLLLTQDEADGALAVRRMLSSGSNQDTVEQLMGMLEKTATNTEFFQRMKSLFASWQKEGFIYGGR